MRNPIVTVLAIGVVIVGGVYLAAKKIPVVGNAVGAMGARVVALFTRKAPVVATEEGNTIKV